MITHIKKIAPPRMHALSAMVAALALAGCVTTPQQQIAPLEAAMILGPSVRDNITPMEPVIACFADHVAATGRAPIVVGVGDVKDYTGKYNINEGNAITQGGALMVYSALGKFDGAVHVAERFDPMIAERELAYADRRQLGDGQSHRLAGPNGGQSVPWLPYFGGSINKSDYYIVGGITELNYDINSGGGQFGVDQIGFKARTFSQSVGVDLRIVDTRTLMIVKTVSLTKHFNGFEVGFNVFRFFDSKLYDINIGAQGQEPVQLGVRAALEEGVIKLISAVTNVNAQPCMTLRPGAGEHIQTTPAERLRKVPNPVVAASDGTATVQNGVAVNTESSSGASVSGTVAQVPFEFGATVLGGGTLVLLDRIAVAAKQGQVDVVLLARDTESWDATKRDGLINQRIAAVTSALANRGIAAAAISVTWRPDGSDNAIHRDGPGMQEIAKLRVGSAAAAPPVIDPVPK